MGRGTSLSVADLSSGWNRVSIVEVYCAKKRMELFVKRDKEVVGWKRGGRGRRRLVGREFLERALRSNHPVGRLQAGPPPKIPASRPPRPVQFVPGFVSPRPVLHPMPPSCRLRKDVVLERHGKPE